jgi:hypothetical protein
MYGRGTSLYNVPWEVPCSAHHKINTKKYSSYPINVLYILPLFQLLQLIPFCCHILFYAQLFFYTNCSLP